MTPKKAAPPEESDSPEFPETEAEETEGEEDSCQSLEDAVTQMQEMAVEGFQAIQFHLKDIQQALLNMEARMGDLAARVHGIEAELGNAEIMPTGEIDVQEKLDAAGQELGKKIREILTHRENGTDAI